MRNKGFNPPDTHKEAKRLRFLRSIDERTQISFVKVARTELLKAEARALLPSLVMLVPEDMSVGWFSKALESVDEVRIITDGRINFIEPSTGLEKKGNSKGSMLLIWRPFISPRRMFTTVSKAALMAIGQGVRRAA